MAADIASSSSPPYIYLRGVPLTAEDQECDNRRRVWEDKFSFRDEFKHMRMPQECFPKALRMEKGTKLFDYNDRCVGGYVVSQRFKDLVESMEPGVHQFSQVDMFHKDGTPYGESFYYFRVYETIDVVNPVLGGVVKSWSTAKPEENPDRYSWKLARGEDYGKLAVFKDKIAGRSWWRDKRYSVVTFASDAFVEKLNAGKFKGWQVINHWQEL